MLIAKHQRRVPGFDEKIFAICAKGMTTRDIQDIAKDLCDAEVSATLVSEILARVLLAPHLHSRSHECGHASG